MVNPDDAPTLTARPATWEWLLAVVLYPLVGLFVGGMLSLGIDSVPPGYLSDTDFSANQLRMGVAGLVCMVPLFVWTALVNRKSRYCAVDAAQLTVGRPPRITVSFESIDRIRVGAPMQSTVKAIATVNEKLGVVMPANRRAAANLKSSFKDVVVVDAKGRSVVIHMHSMAGGPALLVGLLERNPDKLRPSTYTEEELARFGRFKPGEYWH
jgi:hypothetical protein